MLNRHELRELSATARDEIIGISWQPDEYGSVSDRVRQEESNTSIEPSIGQRL